MSMTNFSKEISQLVENQFPEFYREEGTNLVAFIKAYYEFLETNDQYSVKLNRNMFDMRDIDTSLDEFLVQFKETYLADFPFKFRTDTKFAVKNIINYYRSKGSKESLELLMKLLFDEDVSIYYPGEDVLRLSDSSWYKPDYLEVTISSRNSSYINTEITGVKSGAKAFVESVVRKRVKGKVFDVMYLSSVRGTFFAGEKITNDGTTKNAPRIKGSLNDLDIVLGGRNNKIGDQFRVITDEGTGGLVKVSGIVNATGRVDFQIVDGGWGYTTESDTDVYVSSAVLFVNNSNESYFPYERVYQTLETVNIIDAADFTANAAIGSYVVGTTPSAAVCANGYIVSIANTYVDANNTVISTSNASSNAVMTILVSSGSYLDQRGLVLNSNAIGWGVNETITEETTETITITNLSGTFSVGEKVDQTTYETFGTAITNISGTLDANTFVITDVSSVAGLISGQPVTKVSGVGDFKVGTTIETIDAATNTITLNKKPLTSGAIVFNAGTYNVVTAYAFGTIQSANTSQVVLNQAWGEFTTSTLITGKTSGASALPTSITIANADIGAKGIVTSITNAANTASVKVLYGTFDATKQVRGDKSGLIYTINTSGQTGAFHVYLNGVNTANAIIRDSNDATVDGIVIGQDETSIGVHGNTAPFYFSNAYPSFVSTDRSYDTMISPPLDANNNIINVTNQITRIPGGRGADFEIGALTEIESGVTTYSDVVGEANIAGVPYTKIKISGEGSGYGYVQEVTVNYGGTGYINGSSVTFSGGGYGGGNPTVSATGHINVTAGVITAVVIDTYGSGYYESPTITIPNGSGANTTIVMNYGYGFPKNPNAEYYNTIGDVLNTNIVDVGRIALLNKINPGTEYSSNPFVKVRNKSIASFQRGDIILNVTGAGSTPFVAGEDLIQTVGGSTFVKGAVRAVNINDGVGQIFLRRKSTTIAIDTSLPIRGSATGASANVVNMISDPTSNYIGDNSIITGTAISASGVATKLEVVDSGFGYIEGGDVTLMAVANNQFVITAKTHADYQGISQGYWRTTTSHLNSEKRIQDNKYYQEYSYDVLSGLSLNKYEAILRNVFHVSGTRMFGSVVKSSDVNSMPSVVESSIVTTKPVITQLITQSGLVLTTQSGANLTVHKETVV